MQSFYTLTTALGVGSIVLQASSLVLLACFVMKRWFKTSTVLSDIIDSHGYLLITLFVVGASVFSLVYSIVYGLIPCTLCWYQRIFMFGAGITLLSGYFFGHKDAILPPTTLMLGIGWLIGAYHVVSQFTGTVATASCEVSGGASCSEFYFLEFGYITMPVMSLSIFTIALLMILIKTTR